MYESSCTLPISCKGIVFENDTVWLRKNERNEWELPGGRLKLNENLNKQYNELLEELGFKTKVCALVHAHVYMINSLQAKQVFVVIYLCTLIEKVGSFEEIDEAGKAEFKVFNKREVATLNMPVFYKVAIMRAWQSHSWQAKFLSQ